MLTIEHLPFHGDQIDTIKDEDGAWVSLARCCSHLGIGLENQRKKLRSKPWAQMKTERIDTPGGNQNVALIHADSLPMWLATIEPSRVSVTARPILEAYQMEAAKALSDYWNRGMALNPNATDEQKAKSIEDFGNWFSARRIGIDTRKDFVSMISTLRLAERHPDAYRRSTRDLYNRLFNNSTEERDRILQEFIAEKGQKTYVDPDGKRRSYNYRDTLTQEEVSRLEDAERRIEAVATALFDAGIEPEEAYARARDGVMRKLGVTTPF